ncbi:MAG: phosphoribosyltransferase family protein [Caulobacteraceae bacterium]
MLTEAEVAGRVEAVAAAIAPRVDDETIAVCLLSGGLWFAADLTRALHRLGRALLFDAVWLESYGDARVTGGEVRVRAGLQRPVSGRQVLLIDEVIDSGLSLTAGRKLLLEAGAAEVLTAVFARKPWDGPRQVEPDFVAWEAPARFLVGYGMDAAGRLRGLPGVGALD